MLSRIVVFVDEWSWSQPDSKIANMNSQADLLNGASWGMLLPSRPSRLRCLRKHVMPCNEQAIALQEFVRAKQRGSCEIAIPQVRVGWDVSAVGNDRGRGGFLGRIEVVSRGGFVKCVLVGGTWCLRRRHGEVVLLGASGWGALLASMSILFCAATCSA